MVKYYQNRFAAGELSLGLRHKWRAIGMLAGKNFGVANSGSSAFLAGLHKLLLQDDLTEVAWRRTQLHARE